MVDRRSVLAGIGGAIIGATIAAPALARPIDKIRESGLLKIAVYKDFEPWSWRDQTGHVVGIDVELGKLLAEQIGVRAEVTEFLAGDDLGDDLRNMVWRGTLIGQAPCDVMMHVPVDRKLALDNDRVVILGAYYREGFGMVCDRDTTDCEVPPPQLKGKRLIAEVASIPDLYLSGSFGGVLRGDVRHVATGAEAVAAVARGDADAAVATRAQIEHGISISTGDKRALARKGPVPAIANPGWNVGLAVKDDSRDLADKLEEVMADMMAKGRVAEICARFGVQHRDPVIV